MAAEQRFTKHNVPCDREEHRSENPEETQVPSSKTEIACKSLLVLEARLMDVINNQQVIADVFNDHVKGFDETIEKLNKRIDSLGWLVIFCAVVILFAGMFVFANVADTNARIKKLTKEPAELVNDLFKETKALRREWVKFIEEVQTATKEDALIGQKYPKLMKLLTEDYILDRLCKIDPSDDRCLKRNVDEYLDRLCKTDKGNEKCWTRYKE